MVEVAPTAAAMQPETDRPPPRPGRALTWRALWVFLILDAGLFLLGVGRLVELLRRRRAGRVDWPPAECRRQAERTFAAVQRATSLYYRRRSDCLPKALATFHLLRRQGLAAELCFGVRKFPFEAHSWVEAYGVPLDDEPSRPAKYTVINRVPG